MSDGADERDLLTLAEAAAMLGVSRDTIRRGIRRGEVPAVQIGGQPGRPLRVPAGELRQRVAGWSTRARP
jgi:excisionase family DNA binding protein